MKVITYYIIILNYCIAFDDLKINELQKELDGIVGVNKSGVNVNSTPNNTFSEYSIGIWALGNSMIENREIIDSIEECMKKKGFDFVEHESFLTINSAEYYEIME